MAIKCGKCKGYHDSVTEVKWCHNVKIPQSATEAFGLDTIRSRAPLAEEPAQAPKTPVTEGFYKMGNDIVKVVESKGGRLYAKKLELFYDDETVTEVTKGVWEYIPGLISQLTSDMELTEEEAAGFGQLYGVCAICGAVLTNEDSIERGIGPVCFANMGW